MDEFVLCLRIFFEQKSLKIRKLCEKKDFDFGLGIPILDVHMRANDDVSM